MKDVWENAWGLLVEDGWIAAGTVGALVATGLWTWSTGDDVPMHDLGGWLLLVMLMALLIVNLYVAGKSAARR